MVAYATDRPCILMSGDASFAATSAMCCESWVRRAAEPLGKRVSSDQVEYVHVAMTSVNTMATMQAIPYITDVVLCRELSSRVVNCRVEIYEYAGSFPACWLELSH